MFMIYGANGYTGRLTAEEAVRRGHKPVLAGRNKEVARLAEKLGVPHRIFALDEPDAIAKNLEGVRAVLHCAGPFAETSRKMLEACIRAKVHYLDITGEIEVFESVFARNGDLKAAGITAIPGVGFDVVPTDCLAARLKQELPDATHLALAIRFGGKTSPGTSKTMIDGLPKGGMVRRDGKLIRVPTGYEVRHIPFQDHKDEFAVTIPWGDVSTAYYSTRIPNIEVFMAISRTMIAPMKLMGWLTRLYPMKSLIMGIVGRTVSGPSQEERENGFAIVWGEARNAEGRTVELRYRTPDGYHLTVDSSLKSMERLLKGGVQLGAVTPSQAFGADFINDISGVEIGTVKRR
jgi:short subunit dehydrogenase-like uncharacterized protein